MSRILIILSSETYRPYVNEVMDFTLNELMNSLVVTDIATLGFVGVA
jgi:hypothetical protein